MKYIYIIDDGHKRDTPGKNANGLYEYEFNADVGSRVRNKLKDYGEVFNTLESDIHPYTEMTAKGRSQNLNYRTSTANKIYYQAVKKYGKGNFKIIFISIHANAFSNPEVSGYESFVYSHGSEAYELAKAIHKQAQIVLGVGSSINDRGVKEGNFAVLRNTKMPALLIEHEFYTNKDSAKKLLSNDFRERCAEHIFRGALDYMGLQVKDKESIINNDELYRVRKSWEDSKSQLNAYAILNNAKKLVDENEEYSVYDKTGMLVYPIKEVAMQLKYKGLLKLGSRGSDVRELQQALDILGYDTNGIDGIFGVGTNTAIKQFQNDTRIVVDGLVGSATIAMINTSLSNSSGQVVEEEKQEPTKDKTMQLEYKRLLRKGINGSDVKELQQALTTLNYNTNGVDGIFGNGTDWAVRGFQKDTRIVVDGLVGRATVDKINEALKQKEDGGYVKPVPKPNNSVITLRPDRQSTIVKIPLKSIAEIDVAIATNSTKAMTMSAFQKQFKFDYSINGGLFWTDASVKWVRHSLNLLIDEHKQNFEGVYSRFGLSTYDDGTFKFDWYENRLPKMKDMIGGSPTLIINGKKNIDGKLNSGLMNSRHPRSAIGMDANYLYLVTVDGRNNKAARYGMTINELTNFMLELGCTTALNFDGGGSTRMLEGAKVINNPTENRAIHNVVGVHLK